MSGNPRRGIVLALEPSARGLGFVVFDSTKEIIDWGVCEIRYAKNLRCRNRARLLVRGYAPAHVVLEDGDAKSSLRSERVRALLRDIAEDARAEGVGVTMLSRRDVLKRFCLYGVGSNDGLAEAVCELCPELSVRLPKRRRLWDTEHYSMSLFKAAALAITFFTLFPDAELTGYPHESIE